MNEVSNLEEQPENINSNIADANKTFQINKNESLEKVENNETGSSYGKFKDATSLFDAYCNLQAEFTRKSQKLAQLEKNNLSKTDNALTDNNSSLSENREEMPQYKYGDWRQKVADFLTKNPNAKKEAKAMSKILLENRDIAKSKNCLNLAYKLSLANKYVEPASLMESDEFLEKYVVSNSRAQKLIIDNYINSLKNRPIAPATISGDSKNLSLNKPKKIASLSEAKKTIEKMFK